MTETYDLSTELGDVAVTVDDHGRGAPVLLLHGGAGPASVTGFAGLLAAHRGVRVLTPVHPGFDGTPRPDGLASIRALAGVYERLLDGLGLTGVTVIGSSIGGWAAAELALRARDRVDRLVLVDAVGLESAEHPVADFFSLTFDEVIDRSFADPDAHRTDPSTLTGEQRAIAAGNRAALLAYGGEAMTDPALAARLADLTAPTLVAWGAADRIATPAYGEQYAAAIPAATFHLLPDAGHLPQLETPDALLALIDPIIDRPARGPRA